MAATILIIEDDTAVRWVLAQVLNEAGYQVSEAATGRQGRAQFHAQPVDLVLTDLDMPEMTGLDRPSRSSWISQPCSRAFSMSCSTKEAPEESGGSGSRTEDSFTRGRPL